MATHCANPTTCGRPQDGPGHPRKGWIRTHVAGQADSTRWWCSLRCLIHGFTGTPGADRDDVATCVTCINRHDRDHRCPACGIRPQVVQGIPTPARAAGHRLFQQLGHRGPEDTPAPTAVAELLAANGITAADVRAWAKDTGRTPPYSGPIPRPLVEAYLLATRTDEEATA